MYNDDIISQLCDALSLKGKGPNFSRYDAKEVDKLVEP